MSDGHKLAQLMRQAGKTPQNEVVDVVIGEVTSVAPLKIKVESRELTETFLVLGALCKETHIYTDNIKKLDHTHGILSAGSTLRTTQPENASYDIMLWRGLRIGDSVLMLKVGRGQKYVVQQRVEGVI